MASNQDISDATVLYQTDPHLAISISANGTRVIPPVHHPVILVAAAVTVVKVLVALLAIRVRAVVAVIHVHAFVWPVVFPVSFSLALHLH